MYGKIKNQLSKELSDIKSKGFLKKRGSSQHHKVHRLKLVMVMM